MREASPDPAVLEAVAARAVRAGGDYLRRAFRDQEIEAEYGTHDVKSAADEAAEARIVDVIEDAYPDHAIHGEESGHNGEGRYEWVVDPLDGTNNFAAGLPSFASAVCVLRDGRPLVSAVYEPLPDTTYLARRDGGVTVDGEPTRAESDRSLPQGTVSFVVGLPAVRDETHRATAERVERAVSAECKRVINTWSPCVDWGLLATGHIEGLVAYRPDVYEHYAGTLLAREADVERRVVDLDGDGDDGAAEPDPADEIGVDGLYVAAPDREKLDDLLAAATGVIDGVDRSG
ncbi:inositol monophosphatase family protein [Halobellus rubicundus]|uniref:fructose-bisphosphatase n=1 Tax=Halobellus rubicundus TaxID=2996466 RepID=A0ABD5MIH1_9EURY